MSNWTDLLQALAAQKPDVKMVPPALRYEDLWDQQKRIEALEAEVRHLRSVLAAIVEKLQANERDEF